MVLSPSTLRFDKDDSQQNKKLDEMDLDDILNRAEHHETTVGGDGGTSLGGASFLATVAEVNDVKADMNWEDIIPLEERQKIEREEDARKVLVNIKKRKDRAKRKRANAMDDDDEVRKHAASNLWPYNSLHSPGTET